MLYLNASSVFVYNWIQNYTCKFFKTSDPNMNMMICKKMKRKITDK